MPSRFNGAGSGSGGGGSASVGALLRQDGETDRGIFVTAGGVNLGWHLQTEERNQDQAAQAAELRFDNQDQDAFLRVKLPLDWQVEPETLNVRNLVYNRLPVPVAGAKAELDYSALNIKAAVGGTIGNSYTARVDAGTAATEDVSADADIPLYGGSPGVLRQGQIRVTSPDAAGSAVATAASTSSTANRLPLQFDFHQTGPAGNGFIVEVRGNNYSAFAPDPGYRISVVYSNNDRTLTVNVDCWASSSQENVPISEIVDAVNAARSSGSEQLIVASSTDGDTQLSIFRSNNGGIILPLSNSGELTGGAHGSGGGTATNRGGIRLVSSAARVAATFATGSSTVWGQLITATARVAGSGFNRHQLDFRQDTSITANSITVSYSSPVTLVRVNGTVTIQTVIDGVAASSDSTVFASATDPTQTITSNAVGISIQINGGTDEVNPLAAAWSDTDHQLTITALDSDPASEVIAAITALSQFSTTVGPGYVRLAGGGLANGVIDVDNTVGNTIDYAFSGGVDGSVRTALAVVHEALTGNAYRLVISGILNTDTVQDVIDAYSVGTDRFELTAASGSSTTSTLSGAALAETNLAGGVDVVARQTPVVDMGDTGTITIDLIAADDEPQNTTIQELLLAWTRATYLDGDGTTQTLGTTGLTSDTSGGGAIGDPLRNQSLPSVPTGGLNEEMASSVEAVLRPNDEIDGPNILLRYLETDTLQMIFDRLTEQNVVRATVVYNTDLTANPEAPPFSRSLYVSGGTSGGMTTQADWNEGDTASNRYIRNKPTDAEFGDIAFSNPPGDLTDPEKMAARDAIGAGTGTGTATIPAAYSPVWSATEDVVRNDHRFYDGELFIALADITGNAANDNPRTSSESNSPQWEVVGDLDYYALAGDVAADINLFRSDILDGWLPDDDAIARFDGPMQQFQLVKFRKNGSDVGGYVALALWRRDGNEAEMWFGAGAIPTNEDVDAFDEVVTFTTGGDELLFNATSLQAIPSADGHFFFETQQTGGGDLVREVAENIRTLGTLSAGGNTLTDAEKALLDGIAVDVIVYYVLSSVHAEFDALDFGDTVQFAYGTSTQDVTVLAGERTGNVARLIIKPITVWTAIEAEANVTLTHGSDQLGGWTNASRQTDVANVDTSGEWYRSLNESGAGEDVWRLIDRVDRLDDTHLSLGTRTGTTLVIESNTGDDVTIPSSTVTQAGLQSAADKEQLEAISPKWVSAQVYGRGAQRWFGETLYECIVARTVADTDDPATDTTGWAPVARQIGTDLTVTGRSSTGLTVASNTGSNATLPLSSATLAGIQSANDKSDVDAMPNRWVRGIWAQGSYCQHAQVPYRCKVARTAAHNDNPSIDTTGWEPLIAESALDGYINDLSSYSTTAQTTTAISDAIATRIDDQGDWDQTQAYAAHVLVRHDDASYISLVAVAANTQATTEPGTGTDWETSWYRVGYKDGDPNSYSGAALSGDELTLTRIGGTNPTLVDLAGLADIAERRDRTERITFQQVANTNTIVEAQPLATNPTSVRIGAGGNQLITNITGNDFDVPAGVYLIDIEANLTSTNQNDVMIFEFRDASNDRIISYSTVPNIRANSTHITAVAALILPQDLTVNLALDASQSATNIGIAANWTMDIIRWGGSETNDGSWQPAKLAQAEFDLTNGVAVNVGLVDEDSNNIIAPIDGYLIVTFDAPTLGLSGSTELVRADRLRLARSSTDLTTGLYVDPSTFQVFFQADAPSEDSTGNTILFETIETTDAQPAIKPSIADFRVTGESNVVAGNIGGRTYGFTAAISQAGHSIGWRIVGYRGTSDNKPDVRTTLYPPLAIGTNGLERTNKAGGTGTIQIPDPTTLADGEHYTIELQTFATGQAVSNQGNTIYHDFQITAHAVAAQVHFGLAPYTEGQTIEQVIAGIDFAAHDISQSATAAGSYQFTSIPDTGEFIPYWSVPETITQPGGFTQSGQPVSAVIIANAIDRTVGGVDYTIYHYELEARIDNFAEGTTTVVT